MQVKKSFRTDTKKLLIHFLRNESFCTYIIKIVIFNRLQGSQKSCVFHSTLATTVKVINGQWVL